MFDFKKTGKATIFIHDTLKSKRKQADHTFCHQPHVCY